MKREFEELQEESFKETFWDEVEKAQKIMQDINTLKEQIDEYEALIADLEETDLMLDLIVEEDAGDLYQDVRKDIEKLEKRVARFKLTTLLSGEYDRNNAILSINSGAGGLEAQDWAEMLLRLYRRWSERKDFKVETLDLLADPAGGIKSVTLLIKGINAYGYLKAEKGVHRLVRI